MSLVARIVLTWRLPAAVALSSLLLTGVLAHECPAQTPAARDNGVSRGELASLPPPTWTDSLGADYSQQLDPFVQQAKLAASESAGAGIALSADGNTALIGGSSDEGGVGAAWVFIRTGTTWTLQAKLTGAGEIGTGRFGDAVALSADGNTALIGAREDNGEQGAAWVFTRTNGVWTQQGEKLIGGGEGGRNDQGEFGDSVALSADGDTALIGGASDTDYVGAAWVFTRTGTVWTQQGEKLTAGPSGDLGPEFGTSIALSADGNTALIGGPYNEHGVGAAWVYTRTGSTWTQGEKLTGAEEIGEGWFGDSIALSADGNTAIIGAPFDNEWVGATWTFTRSGSTWTQQGEKLTGGGEIHSKEYAGLFGDSIALSAGGDTALIAASTDNGRLGAVWTFTRTGSSWTQQGEKLTGGIEESDGFRTSVSSFGSSLALSADGDTALIVGYYGINSTGAAWVFVNPSPSVVTGAASSLGESTATLNGTVDPGPATTAYFQYGTSETYGNSTLGQSIEASTSAGPLTTNVTGLLPGTTYRFRLVSENSLGTIYGEDQTFTTATSPAVPPTTTPPTTSSTTPTSPPSTGSTTTTTAIPAGSPSTTTTAPPVITNVAQSNRTWRSGTRLSRRSGRHEPTPLGTMFSFNLNEQASVTLTFQRNSAGRRVNGSCVAQTRKNHGDSICHELATAEGTIILAGHRERNEVRFTGVIPYSKTLEPGFYTLIIMATNGGGQRSKATKLKFTVVE